MPERLIEIEADTLEQAREQIRSQMPDGFELLSEQTISDGKPKTVRGIAETIETAFEAAQSDMPSHAVILEKKEISPAAQRTVTVDALDDQVARTESESQIGETEIITAIRMVSTGSKGFLGIGKRPHKYEAQVFRQAVVEVTYATRAKVSARIGECPPIEDWALAIGTARGFMEVVITQIADHTDWARLFGLGSDFDLLSRSVLGDLDAWKSRDILSRAQRVYTTAVGSIANEHILKTMYLAMAFALSRQSDLFDPGESGDAFHIPQGRAFDAVKSKSEELDPLLRKYSARAYPEQRLAEGLDDVWEAVRRGVTEITQCRGSERAWTEAKHSVRISLSACDPALYVDTIRKRLL